MTTDTIETALTGSRKGHPGGDTTGVARQNKQMTERYVADLRERGETLPASLDQPAALSIKIAAEESGVPYHALVRGACRTILIDAVPELHVSPRRPQRLNDRHRLKDLANLADARIEFECARNGRDGKTAREEMREAFKALAETHGWVADAGDVFAAAGLSAGDAGSLGLARRMLDDARHGLGTPESFHCRFRYECALVGLAPRSLAQLAGFDEQSLHNWGTGAKVPNKGTKPAFDRIEAFLALPNGTLWNLIKRPRDTRGYVKSTDLPPEYDTRYKKEKAKKRLPDDISARLPEEKAELLAELRTFENTEEQRPTAKIAKQRQDEYRLKDVPPHLQRELSDLFAHRKPRTMLLGNKQLKDGLNEGGVSKWRQRYLLFFGFLVNRLHELDQVPEYRDKGPFQCVKPQDLTVGLLMMPQLIVAYGRWLTWRKTVFGRPGTATYDDVELLKEVERLTRVRPNSQTLDTLFRPPSEQVPQRPTLRLVKS